MRKKYFTVRLNLFDGEGSATGAAAPEGEAGSQTGENTQASAANSKRARNPLADVVYGKQPESQSEEDGQAAAVTVTDNTGASEQQETPEARKARFDSLINGEFKDLWDEKTKDIAKNRVSRAKELETQNSNTQQIMDMLAQKYGVKNASDYNALMKAINEDDSFFEAAASEQGMSVEQYKHMQQLERDNAQLRSYREEAERRTQADQVYAGWIEQSEQLKAFYPGFNLKAELQNVQFGKMLGAGVGVKAAYEAIHHDEIMSGALQRTVKNTAKKVADGIASRNSRPVENGVRSQASASVRADVSKLTKADRAEIARRARMGASISF